MHKPDVGEAKSTKHKLVTTKAYNKQLQTTGAEGRALHKHDVCEAKHAKQKITE